MGDAIMAVSYKRLWKLLVDKKMSKQDLRKKAEIAPNTMTKLRRDEEESSYRQTDTIWWCMSGFVILRDSTLLRSVLQTDQHTL